MPIIYEPDENEREPQNPVLSMIRAYREVAAAVLLTGLLATGAAAWVTKGVANKLDDVREAQAAAARSDSLYRVQVSDVVELIAIAMVEPAGSPDRRDALRELRRRRHVTR